MKKVAVRGLRHAVWASVRSFRVSLYIAPSNIIGDIIGVVILLLLYTLMVVVNILIFENLGIGTLPTPPN